MRRRTPRSRRRSSAAYVALSPTFGGRLVVDGELDAEAGGVVLAALDARCGPATEGLDGWPRTLPERRAQALVEMCAESMDRAARSGRVPVALDVVVDVATMQDEPLANLTGVSCEIEGVGPVAPETARRLACDAAVARVVMRGRSEVLDLGRRTRVVCGRSAGRSCTATAVASSPVAIGSPAGAMRITSCPGGRAARPISPTWACCAAGTMLRSTRAVGACGATRGPARGSSRRRHELDQRPGSVPRGTPLFDGVSRRRLRQTDVRVSPYATHITYALDGAPS